MPDQSLDQLIDRLRAVEAEIEAAFAARDAARAAEAGFTIENGKPCFKADALRRQRAHRKGLNVARTPWPTLLTMP